MPWDLKGDPAEDFKKGIYHLNFHKGILHQASFKKTDQPYLRQARIQSHGYNPLVHLSNTYDVDLTLLGNTLFYPGQYIFINPLNFGTSLGLPTQMGSISNAMGLGGYHFIIEVNNTLGKTFAQSIKARWDNNGSNSVRSTQYPTSKTDNEDCPS